MVVTVVDGRFVAHCYFGNGIKAVMQDVLRWRMPSEVLNEYKQTNAISVKDTRRKLDVDDYVNYS